MGHILEDEQLRWCEEHTGEALALLKELARIPAPTHHEERRAAFVRGWLEARGARGVVTDEARNVLLPLQAEEGPVAVLMAHTDVVFPDTEPLPLREEGGRVYAPGVGDDTGNLVALLMAAAYCLEHGVRFRHGVVIVANSCEEGLGNLKGSGAVLDRYAGRVEELISIDGNADRIVDDAVGSHRYRVTIHAQGGHSYNAFGQTNAIVQMADLIRALYDREPPAGAKTTWNVGVIEGGTTVNSICAECSILYEYRSASHACLCEMEAFLRATLAAFREKGVQVEAEVLGIRPCAVGVDPARQTALAQSMKALQEAEGGCEVTLCPGSTDANSALGRGIPAVTIGGIRGKGAHTRDEWIETASMGPALRITLAALLRYRA